MNDILVLDLQPDAKLININHPEDDTHDENLLIEHCQYQQHKDKYQQYLIIIICISETSINDIKNIANKIEYATQYDQMLRYNNDYLYFRNNNIEHKYNYFFCKPPINKNNNCIIDFFPIIDIYKGAWYSRIPPDKFPAIFICNIAVVSKPNIEDIMKKLPNDIMCKLIFDMTDKNLKIFLLDKRQYLVKKAINAITLVANKNDN